MGYSWVTSSAIEFTSNGVKVMADLSKATKRLAADMKAVQANVDAAMASMNAFAASAVRVTDAMVDLNAATGKANSSATRSTTRVTRAAAAYDAMAASAARAATAVESVAAARPRLALGGGGGGRAALTLPGVVGGLPALAMRTAKTAATLGAGLAIDAVYEAGKLQTILQTTQNITGANNAQMLKARQAMFNVGDTTGMSVDQAATMFREIARNTQGSMSFGDMLGLLPQVAKMQMVLGAARNFTPAETVDNTLALVHLFRKYDPKGQPKMMDTVLRMGELMPSNLKQAVTQMGYFLPAFKSLHIKDEDAAAMMVAASRFGMARGRGGTSLANLVNQAIAPLQMTQHAQAGKAALMGPHGLNIIDAKGKSRFFTDRGGDILGFLDQLAAFEKKFGSIKAGQTFKSVFRITGSRMADVLADPVMIDQIHKIIEAIKNQKSLGVDSQSHTIAGTFDFQAKRSWNDFQSLMTDIGSNALPGATKGLKDLGDSLHGAQIWLHQHKDLEDSIARWSTQNITELEYFFKAHAGDFKYMGRDAVTAMHSIDGLAHALGALGGIALTTYGDVHRVNDWIAKHLPFLKPPDQLTDASSASTNAKRLYDQLRGKRMVVGPTSPTVSVGHLNLVQEIGKAIADALGIDPANAKRNSWGGTYVEQHFDMRGQPLDANTMLAAARAGVHAAMAAGPKHGTQFTHPAIPAPRTVSQHHGAH